TTPREESTHSTPVTGATWLTWAWKQYAPHASRRTDTATASARLIPGTSLSRRPRSETDVHAAGQARPGAVRSRRTLGPLGRGLLQGRRETPFHAADAPRQAPFEVPEAPLQLEEELVPAGRAVGQKEQRVPPGSRDEHSLVAFAPRPLLEGAVGKRGRQPQAVFLPALHAQQVAEASGMVPVRTVSAGPTRVQRGQTRVVEAEHHHGAEAQAILAGGGARHPDARHDVVGARGEVAVVAQAVIDGVMSRHLPVVAAEEGHRVTALPGLGEGRRVVEVVEQDAAVALLVAVDLGADP